MPKRKATYVDYQARATEFQVGMPVVHWGKPDSQAGRVVAVYPAIGMVDVQFPWGNTRESVLDIQILNKGYSSVVTPRTQDVPGGAGTVEVPGGPPLDEEDVVKTASPKRVLTSFLEKKAIYWADKGRTYRATRQEQDSGDFYCPRCAESVLRPAVYKKKVRLLGCPECLFLIKQSDLIGCEHVNPPPEEEEPILPSGHGQILQLLRGDD